MAAKHSTHSPEPEGAPAPDLTPHEHGLMPRDVAYQIGDQIGQVAQMMYALHELAVSLESGVSAATLGTVTENLSWRCGQILDGCARQLGYPETGYFRERMEGACDANLHDLAQALGRWRCAGPGRYVWRCDDGEAK